MRRTPNTRRYRGWQKPPISPSHILTGFLLESPDAQHMAERGELLVLAEFRHKFSPALSRRQGAALRSLSSLFRAGDGQGVSSTTGGRNGQMAAFPLKHFRKSGIRLPSENRFKSMKHFQKRLAPRGIASYRGRRCVAAGVRKKQSRGRWPIAA